jgi:hypothetical protein
MAQEPARPDHDEEAEDVRNAAIGTPRWVKVVGIVSIVAVLVAALLLLVLGGSHGPGRHAASADGGERAAQTVRNGGALPRDSPAAGRGGT